MALDGDSLFRFLLVFVRASAMFMAAPIFGAANVPLRVRIFLAGFVSVAVASTVGPKLGSAPADLIGLGMAVGYEVFAGLLIGMFLSVAVQAATIAGALIDLQMGLSISQAMNPINGVSVTVLAQFKFLLATVLYLLVDGHHAMFQAFVEGYGALPGAGGLAEAETQLIALLGQMMVIALQIAVPVMAVGLVVDAALGLINKAVPTMQALQFGMPAKILMGMLALGLALPALTSGVYAGVGAAMESLGSVFRGR